LAQVKNPRANLVMFTFIRNLVRATAIVTVSNAMFLRGSSSTDMAVHFDTTCGHCQEWILHQFKPLWENHEFQLAVKKQYNISFWAHTITSHNQAFDLNLVLDCASKHLAQADYFTMLFNWMQIIEPWKRVDGGDYVEKTVDVSKLLVDSMPKRSGFDGLATVQKCADFERLPTVEWVRTNTPASFHSVPTVIVENSWSDEAVNNLQDYMCGQIRRHALQICGGSLMQEDASQSLCVRVEAQSAGQILLQHDSRMSKLQFVALDA